MANLRQNGLQYGHTGDATDHVPGHGLATAAGLGLKDPGGVVAVAAPSWQLEVCEGEREPRVICKQGARRGALVIKVHFLRVVVAGIVQSSAVASL
ncbi:hypothetical protein Pmani_024676 [Petrolisthes manimaculis]|uniref:Uncharacterized protein n=1 Tax=Petrolisthes manimaculis TaxID=1843537 RepID=A0AAE1TZT3_9EUCA|nr:hypothetical protein Pmani_024676 [Petrolisthes manimaculis]